MARPFIMPDPDDRSKNDPAVLVESVKILGYFNQEHKNRNEKASYVSEAVRTWYTDKAQKRGWDSVRFIGSQAILQMNLNQDKKSEER